MQLKKLTTHVVKITVVVFSSFTKNGHTVWFDPQMKKLEPHCIVKQTVPQQEYLAEPLLQIPAPQTVLSWLGNFRLSQNLASFFLKYR